LGLAGLTFDSKCIPPKVACTLLRLTEPRAGPRLCEAQHSHAATATLKESYVRFSRVRYGVKSPFGLELRMNQEVERSENAPYLIDEGAVRCGAVDSCVRAERACR